MRHLALVVPFALAACTTDPTLPGRVTAFNGETVELAGAFPWDGKFQSTPGLDASAREVCPNARWIGWRDDGSEYHITHIYRC